MRRRSQQDGESAAALDKIEAAFTDLEATVNDLLSFTTDRKPRVQRFSLAELVEGLCGALRPQLAAQRIEVVTAFDQVPPITADRDMVCRAVLNLVLNALDAMPGGGSLSFHISEGQGGVELAIADTGEGIDADARRRMFEPFYSTKAGGTGLGLAIVSRVAEVHGGEVLADSRPGQGATFTLMIPRRPWEVAA